MTEYGIQLYSVRDIAKTSLENALEKVAALGYKYVEFAGFYGHSAEEVKAMLEKYNLVISGTHSGWGELRPTQIAETLAYHKAIGNPYYNVPNADLSTLEKIEEFCAVMNFAQPILAAENIKLAFHNHSTEFRMMPWGSTIHAEIERRTNIDFELDTFWLFNAQVDPIATMEKLKDRVHVIHIKDGFAGGKGIPLGEGEAPVQAVREKAVEMGLTIIVESETLTPSGIDEAERCIKYLRSIE